MYKKDKLALKINEYVETNGTDTVMDNDEILLLAGLEDAGLKATDYCYNYVNSRIASKYDAVPHLFEYLGKNQYRVLGENYPYNGDAVRYYKEKSRAPEILGRWADGIFDMGRKETI